MNEEEGNGQIPEERPLRPISDGIALLRELQRFHMNISSFESVSDVEMLIGFPEAATRRNKPILKLSFYNESGELANLNGRPFSISPSLTGHKWPAHAEIKLDNGIPIFRARVSWGRLSESALQKKADDLNRQRYVLGYEQDAKASDFDPLVITEIRFLTNAPLADLEDWERFGHMYSRENNMNRISGAQTTPVSNTRVVQPASYARMNPHYQMGGSSIKEDADAVSNDKIKVDKSLERYSSDLSSNKTGSTYFMIVDGVVRERFMTPVDCLFSKERVFSTKEEADEYLIKSKERPDQP